MNFYQQYEQFMINLFGSEIAFYAAGVIFWAIVLIWTIRRKRRK